MINATKPKINTKTTGFKLRGFFAVFMVGFKPWLDFGGKTFKA